MEQKPTIAVADTNYKEATDGGYDNLKIHKNIFTTTISSNVTTEKQKTNNTGTEKVVEDTTTVKTVGSNNKDDSNIVQKNNQNTANKQQKVTSVDKKQKLNYSISIEKKADNGKKIRIYITILLFYLISI